MIKISIGKVYGEIDGTDLIPVMLNATKKKQP